MEILKEYFLSEKPSTLHMVVLGPLKCSSTVTITVSGFYGRVLSGGDSNKEHWPVNREKKYSISVQVSRSLRVYMGKMCAQSGNFALFYNS